MTNPPGPQSPQSRERFVALLLLAVGIVWAAARTWRSVKMLFAVSHDLDIYYSLWFLLSHRDYAALALSQALYLPHTWVVLTPLFVLGWPTGRVLMLLLNIVSVFYLWWRLSELVGLKGLRKWLLLVFFWGWLGTGLILGLGNLALVCVAATVAAYPFKSPANGIFLMLAAMKQTLVFPLYFYLLFKRPRILIIPFATFGVCGVAALLWAQLGITDAIHLAKGSTEIAGAWTLYDFTCLRRVFAPFMKSGLTMTIMIWSTWFALYAVCLRCIKDSLHRFSALLLLSLLPMYHQRYDVVAAVPLLAILLSRGSLLWPVLMTLSLASDFGVSFSRIVPSGFARRVAEALEQAYYPILILIFLAGLIYLDSQGRSDREKEGLPQLPEAEKVIGNQEAPNAVPT